jgi:hypothetical protein
MAKRMDAKTIAVKASHLSLISRPDEITQLTLGRRPARMRREKNTSDTLPDASLRSAHPT